MPRSDMYAIPGKDAGLTYRRSECEAIGEHQGDPVTRDRPDGRWEEWTCCADREYVGELTDCDTCLAPGLIPDGGGLPEGWIEDTNGAHCPKCYPKEWLT